MYTYICFYYVVFIWIYFHWFSFSRQHTERDKNTSVKKAVNEMNSVPLH